MRAYTFELGSTLSVPPAEFWKDATLQEVNTELAPWVRMTAPAEWRDRPLREWPSGRTLFKSWVLLFGLLPVDLHYFFLQSVDPQSGFEERSSSVMNRRWVHIRRIVPVPGGCSIIDHLTVEPRIPMFGAVLVPVYEAIFRSRHRRLLQKYGKPATI